MTICQTSMPVGNVASAIKPGQEAFMTRICQVVLQQTLSFMKVYHEVLPLRFGLLLEFILKDRGREL